MHVELAERIEEILEGPLAIVVATVDDDGVPAIARAWGGRLLSDSDDLELAVTAPDRSATREHLGDGDRVSVTLSEMTTYSTVQAKGGGRFDPGSGAG